MLLDASHPADTDDAPDPFADDDDEAAVPIRRPLDLGLAFDGGGHGGAHRLDLDVDDVDHDENALLFAQDGAGGVFDAQDDTDDYQPPQPRTVPPEETWYIIRAERDADGEWRTIGEPLPDADFSDLDLAFMAVDRLNRRDFGKGFDWLKNPPRAWLAVRVGQVGALRVNRPQPQGDQ